MQIIGITGITGAGKSTVSKMVCEILNAKHIDADKIAKESAKNGEIYYEKIVKEFGTEILNENMEINRKKLAKIVFFNKQEKEKLDKLTDMYVVPKIIHEAEKNATTRDVVIDVPLLFEVGLDKICDITIGVIAPKEKCIERIINRDGINREIAIARMENQKSENFFKRSCNYIVFNQDENDVMKQLDGIFNGKNLSSECVIEVKNYIQFRKLLEYSDKITHCYTLRMLDFGNINNYEEKKKDVVNTYRNICESLGLDKRNVFRPYQTHTNIVKEITNEQPGIFTEDFMNVDGLITDEKNKVLSLTFADCTPLLFYDQKKNVIGNIHSGWQGTYKEIAREAVKKLKEKYYCNSEDLICCIGPHIRKCCFEVDKDVKDMFFEKFKYTGRIEEIITPSRQINKYYIDTALINKIILIEEGLKEENIIDSNICTKCKCEKLHSYRANKEKAGRSTSLISII